MLVAAFASLLGYQLIIFALFTKIFAVTEGLHPSTQLSRVPREINLEVGVLAGLGMILAGFAFLGYAFLRWRATGFGVLDPRITMRQVIPSVVLLTLGVQTVFASFFLSVLTLRRRNR